MLSGLPELAHTGSAYNKNDYTGYDSFPPRQNCKMVSFPRRCKEKNTAAIPLSRQLTITYKFCIFLQNI
jgi:hypothetical protein